jgi:ABC-type Na+ transport system ATPase subunit NatA
MYQLNQSTVSFLQAVEHSLKSVRLFDDGIADKRVAKYSGGMKRRLSVAISLIGDPKVLVFTYLTIIQETSVFLVQLERVVSAAKQCGMLWCVFLVQFYLPM